MATVCPPFLQQNTMLWKRYARLWCKHSARMVCCCVQVPSHTPAQMRRYWCQPEMNKRRKLLSQECGATTPILGHRTVNPFFSAAARTSAKDMSEDACKNGSMDLHIIAWTLQHTPRETPRINTRTMRSSTPGYRKRLKKKPLAVIGELLTRLGWCILVARVRYHPEGSRGFFEGCVGTASLTRWLVQGWCGFSVRFCCGNGAEKSFPFFSKHQTLRVISV